MAGNTDSIHGWNLHYRNRIVDPENNFDSFWFNHGRPGNFNYRLVEGTNVYDHQGHIVPQTMLNIVLDPIMMAMSGACNNVGDIADFINGLFHGIPARPWLQQVLDYETALQAPPISAPEAAFFDWGEQNPEDKVGGFFSIITWNPINICRAPNDIQRGNYPVNAVDAQVLTYLDAHNIPPIADAACLIAAQNTINNPYDFINPANPANVAAIAAIEAYLITSSATLAPQLIASAGYYAFPWKINPLAPGVLVPA